MPQPWDSSSKFSEHLNQQQRDGLACVHCGRQNRLMQPVEAWSSRLYTAVSECIDKDDCTDYNAGLNPRTRT